MQTEIQIGNIQLIRPGVNYASFMSVPAGSSWGPRIIPDCQFIHVVSGSAEVILNGASRIIQSGETAFYGAETPHQIITSSEQPFTFYSIHFSWDRLSAEPVPPYQGLMDCSLQELTKQGPLYSVKLDGFGSISMPHFFYIPKIENLMAPLVKEFMLAETGYAVMMRGQLFLLLMEIVRSLITNRSIGSEQSKKIAPVLEAMQNEPNRSWTTKELARIGGYHPTYFAALFKEAVGHAPKHYLILEKIRLAKNLLLELETIEATADKLGYSSVHYFSRHFKEITGFTPSEYKKRSTFL